MDRDEAAPEYRFATRAGLEVLEWPLFDGHPLRAVVTTRKGGLSGGVYRSLNLGLHVGDDPGRVQENRRSAAAAIGLELDDLVFCNQAHGREVVEVTGADRGRGARSMDGAVAEADAMVTSDAGVGLVVMVADCVPIVLFDPVTRTLACVHAGWRGTVARVAGAAVEVIAGRGAAAGDLLAAIGPAIAPARYEVGEDVKAAAEAAFGDFAAQVLAPHPAGRYRFDLWRANRRVLLDAGLRPENLALAGLDTGGERFFSDRAARPCGRFAALAQITAGHG